MNYKKFILEHKKIISLVATATATAIATGFFGFLLSMESPFILSSKKSESAIAINLTEEEINWLSDNRNLTVSIKPGWAPITFLSENGEYRGISIEILKKVEHKLGVKFNKIQAKENIDQESADIILATISTPIKGQSRYLLLNDPYLVSPYLIYTNKDNQFKDLRSLKDKKVAAFRSGPVAKNIAEHHPDIHIYAADIAEEALDAVLTKKVDAYIGNSVVIDYTLINQGFRDIRSSGSTPYQSEIYMAVKSDLPLLMSALEKAIASISIDERRNLVNSWTIKSNNLVDVNYKIIFIILTVSLALISIFYIANKRLNKEIEVRKIVEQSLVEERNKAEAAELLIRSYSNKLKLLNENLEEKVVARTRDLEIEIEERKNTEQILRNTQNTLVETEKMASLGNLVAGIAHEVNTPLGITVTAASHLKEQSLLLIDSYNNNTIKRSSLEEYFDLVLNATNIVEENLNRAAELVHSFKEVSVDQIGGDFRRINLLSYIKQILISLQPQFKRLPINIELTNIDENLILELQPGALSQVITNLIINSLVHGFDEKQQGLISLATNIKGKDLELTYQDNGMGIPQENLRKIFEPFFTTKRGNGGSGLGMHIVYNIIVQKFHGKIDVESEIGKGVLFHIHIPNCVIKG